MKRFWMIVSVLLTIGSMVVQADEGMWLPHQMKMLNLQEQGLRMNPNDLFKEDGTGLMSAIVSFGGGTGEFVSSNGLLLTNHHVAFGAIQRAADKEHDYNHRRFPCHRNRSGNTGNWILCGCTAGLFGCHRQGSGQYSKTV